MDQTQQLKNGEKQRPCSDLGHDYTTLLTTAEFSVQLNRYKQNIELYFSGGVDWVVMATRRLLTGSQAAPSEVPMSKTPNLTDSK